MSEPSWHFVPHQAGTTKRNPVSSEFFANDTHLDAIVREAIQNSLDAHGDAKRIAVRIYFSGNTGVALAGSQYKPYLTNASAHYQADGNGLARPLPTATDDCPFLAIEDFETTGLTGSVTEAPLKSEKNRAAWNYHDYFYCDGSTSKGRTANADTLGSWGAGKCTFMRASRLKTVFTLSVRDGYEPRKFLAGKMTLQGYQDDTGVDWLPDAIFGVDAENTPKDSNRLFPVLPLDGVNHADWIRQFEQDFNLIRGDRPGASIVIPYVRFDKNSEEGDLSEDVKQELVRAVLRNFLVALVDNRLEVTISSGLAEDDIVINKENLSELSVYLPEEAEGVQKVTITRRHFNLATAVLDAGFDEHRIYTLSLPYEKAPEIDTEKLFAGLDVKKIKKQLLSEKPLLFKVPMRLQVKPSEEHSEGTTVEGWFKVAIVRAPITRAMKTAYYRIGLLVPEVAILQLPNYVTMTFIDEGEIAKMLIAAEPPAHNKWGDNAERITNDYFNAVKHIAYVSQMATKIIQAISVADKEPDENALIDIFGIDIETEGDDEGDGNLGNGDDGNSDDDGGGDGNGDGNGNGDGDNGGDNSGNAVQKLLSVEQVESTEVGFAISMSKDVVAKKGYPIKVKFRFGYRTDDKGLDWDPTEWNFSDGKKCPISISLTAASEQGVVSWGEPVDNRLELTINRPGAFTVLVLGFNRDLEYSCERSPYIYPEEEM